MQPMLARISIPLAQISLPFPRCTPSHPGSPPLPQTCPK
jgi:hypothetical protein